MEARGESGEELLPGEGEPDAAGPYAERACEYGGGGVENGGKGAVIVVMVGCCCGWCLLLFFLKVEEELLLLVNQPLAAMAKVWYGSMDMSA